MNQVERWKVTCVRDDSRTELPGDFRTIEEAKARAEIDLENACGSSEIAWTGEIKRGSFKIIIGETEFGISYELQRYIAIARKIVI